MSYKRKAGKQGGLSEARQDSGATQAAAALSRFSGAQSDYCLGQRSIPGYDAASAAAAAVCSDPAASSSERST